jgi:hypothetical protein
MLHTPFSSNKKIKEISLPMAFTPTPFSSKILRKSHILHFTLLPNNKELKQSCHLSFNNKISKEISYPIKNKCPENVKKMSGKKTIQIPDKWLSGKCSKNTLVSRHSFCPEFVLVLVLSSICPYSVQNPF